MMLHAIVNTNNPLNNSSVSGDSNVVAIDVGGGGDGANVSNKLAMNCIRFLILVLRGVPPR